jgi:hypothetical protein
MKRILLQLDGEEMVIFGTIRGRENPNDPHNGIAEITEEGEDEPIRVAWLDILEIRDARPRQIRQQVESDKKPKPSKTARPSALEQSPAYRRSLQDSGRGHLLP